MKFKDWFIIGVGVSALVLSVIFLSKDMVHYVFEALALPFGIFFIWYGFSKANGFYRYIFIIFGAGNIIVDGYLLARNILFGGII